MKSVAEKIRATLKDDPRVALVLSEILGPPPALAPRPRPWEAQATMPASYPVKDGPRPRGEGSPESQGS